MAENDKRPHLIISNTARAELFTSPRSRGSEPPIPQRDRNQHGQRLLAQIRALTGEAEGTIEEQRAFGVDVGNGIFLEFESEPGFELPTESLGDARKRIELLSVKEDEERIIATVFVPEGRLQHFENLITQYVEQNTPKGKPRHEKLVAQIQQISLAALDAMWTDDPALMPQADEAAWWEIWLRATDDRTGLLTFFREYAGRIGLQVSDYQLHFPERIIITARGTKTQLAHSVRLLNCVAEIRKPKDTAEFFVNLLANEQRDWMHDLINRTQIPGMDVPFVCLLDTGVNQAHLLLSPVLDANDMDKVNPAWNPADQYGHGTQMAGLATYGDLVDALASNGRIFLTHRLESVKILQRPGANAGELYGDLTREAVARAEILGPQRKRVISMAVTSLDNRDRGRPSAWSAAVDALCSGAEDDVRRLIVLAAGNIPREHWRDYPARNSTESIHDPGQAWNALTVGAYTDKTHINPDEYPGWEALAPAGGLSPSSSTSQTWESHGQLRAQWPLKPDVVFEGGNGAMDPEGGADALPSLSLLTTYHQHLARPFDQFGDTSGAAALAARMAAQIQYTYPDFWPETVRALIVHSAEWAPAMKQAYAPHFPRNKTENKRLIRHCGFGVPSLDAALWSAKNDLTLIAQEELQPFDQFEEIVDGRRTRSIRTRDMHLHAIPWPREVLLELAEIPVEMRVTLSYFIEPNPAARGWTRRYRYESHGLRFDVKRPEETLDQFRHRVNRHARDEEEGRLAGVEDHGWVVGQARHLGSLHSDIWTGTAAELAERGYIAVYPALGWWRERKHLNGWQKRTRYALVVNLSMPDVNVDIYNTVAAEIAAPIAIQLET